MKKRVKCFMLFGLLIVQISHAQTINLVEFLKNNQLEVVNRQVTIEQNHHIKLSEERQEGLIWIKGITFSEGTIELDLKGQDVFQRSFIGVAFHGQNDSTYEAIYFRPFNFYAKDTVRYIHAVQYVAHPTYTWRYLREKRNGEFEKPVSNAPNPNEWFHAKIEVINEGIRVFVENRETPVLVVPRLVNCQFGKIGIFVGDGSGGEFKNLIISDSNR